MPPRIKAPKPLHTRDGALFVQVDGPNTKPEYVGCVDLDAIEEPGGGIAEITRCFAPDGNGWNVLSYTTTPPDPITTTLTALIYKTRQRLDEVRQCPITLFVMQREAGRPDQFTNYVRGTVLYPAILGDRTRNALVMREEDTPATKAYAVSALPPVLEAYKKVTSRVGMAETAALNAVSFCNSTRCASSSGPAQREGKVGFVAGDHPAASATTSGDVYYTTDYGATWTRTADDPFEGGEDVAAITCFDIDQDTTRVLAARGTTDADDPMEIAYSDDFGTTWTRVDVGATDAQFAKGPNALFAFDQYHIWLVVDDGYVYFSEDGGATWETQESGGTTTSDLYAVHFASYEVGYAAGAAGDVLRTIDGGFSWSLVTDPVNAIINTVIAIDAQKAWAGSAGGRLYFTEDGGTTWTERAFSGNGSGQVRAIQFYNDLFGYMLHNTAGPVGRVFATIDGGYTWESITTATNSGLNAIALVGENDFWAVGEPNSGTAVLLKGLPAQ